MLPWGNVEDPFGHVPEHRKRVETSLDAADTSVCATWPRECLSYMDVMYEYFRSLCS
jgi:hypothetical protein